MADRASLLDLYLAPDRAPRTADPLDRILYDRARWQANANLLRSGVDPERAARANIVGRKFGLPAEIAERNLETLETRLRQQTAAGLFDRRPLLQGWSADPRNAAVATDDLEQLAKASDAYEKRWGVLKAPPPRAPTVWNFFKGIWESLVEGKNAARSSASLMLGDMGVRAPRAAPGTPTINSGDGIEQDMRRIRRAQAGMEQAAPAFQSATWRGIYGGVSSLAYMSPGIALSVAARNPAPLLGYAGLSTGVPAYGKYRARGSSPGMAALGATAEAGIEVATEAIGARYLSTAFGTTGFREFVGGMLLREVPGEWLAMMGQDAVDTAIANPDKTWAEYWAERPGRSYETFIATLTQSTLTGGPSALARGYAERQARETAAADAALVDGLMDAAADSKTRQRDPEAFKRFLEMHQGEAVENIYLPAEKVRELFQSDAFDAREFFEAYSDQIEEAEYTGGDIVIPLPDAVARLAGTKAWEHLKDDARLSPGGMSVREARTFDEAKADELEAAGSEMDRLREAEVAAMEPRQKVYEAVRDELMRNGYRADAAASHADLYGAHYAAIAEAFGTDALSEFERAGLKVRQILPERLARTQAADGLDILIAALKRGTEGKRATSLLEFIAARGGIEDVEGDLAAMGADAWHKEKAFRRKLVRPARDDSPSLLGDAAQNDNTPDALALAAWEAGFFPEAGEERPTVDAFYQAVRDELHGRPRYADESRDEISAAAEELREILDREGVDAATANEGDIRAAVKRFEAEQADGRAYGQDNDGKRGRIVFGDEGAVVELFEARDLSTFLHETGHLWLEELWKNAERPDAPQWMKDGKAAVAKWFADNGHAADGDAIPTEAHEMWARGFERYAMEGKAPSATLRKAFDSFRAWLLQIYKHVFNLQVEISPEVADVMGRLLATDLEIEEARRQQQVEALFTSAEQAGMTEAEFAAYQRAASDARSEAYDALLYRTMHVIRAEKTAEWKDELDRLKEEVSKEVDGRREFRALAALTAREPRMKLPKAWLVENYGDAALSLVPQAVPPIYAERDTVDPDSLAELYGFTSADEMVRTLMGIERQRKALRGDNDRRSVREVLIDQLTKEQMRERHGDPLADGSIEEEALALIHNEKQGEVIASELRALGKKTGQRPTPYRIARQWAARKIAQSKVIDSTSGAAIQQYQRAAAKAAKEAEAAMLRGDPNETYRQKQAQMLNSALVAEAKAARDVVDAAVKRLGALARKPTVAGLDSDYLQQVHALLERYDFRPRSNVAVGEREAFHEWLQAREDEGLELYVPPRLMDVSKHYSRMTVEELRGLDDTVRQIVHVGKLKHRLLKDKEARDLAEIGYAIEDAILSSAKFSGRDLRTRNTKAAKAGLAARGFLAMHRKLASWAQQLDGREGGPLWEHIVRPMNDSADAEAHMRAEATAKLHELTKPLLAEGKMGGKGKFFPSLGLSLNREERIGIVLNMGNASNLQRLLDGERWTMEDVRPVLDSLTKTEMDFVQGVWDFFEGFRPQIAAKERRIYGVEPEWIEAQPLETQHGEYRGGYYPVKFDPRRSSKAEQHSDAEAAKRQLKGAYTTATPRRSFTKARVEQVRDRPLNYTMAGLWQGTTEVIHDLAWHEWLIDTNKLLRLRTVDSAIRLNHGPEGVQIFKKAIEDIAAGDVPAQSVFEAGINHIRMGATVAGLGWNLKTALLQPFGLTQSMVRIGPAWVARGLGRWFKEPIAAVQEVNEKSTFMRHRSQTMQREINEIQNRISGGKSDLRQLIEASFFVLIQKTQMVADMPTWLGAYEKAVAGGNDEARAVALADQAVRDAQGGGQVSDLAAIQRGGPLLKLFTNFYSYFNVTYNLSAESVARTDFRKPGDVMRLALDYLLLYSVPASLAFFLGQALAAVRGDGDDDWWSDLAAENLSYMMGTMVGVRELAGGAQAALGVKQYETTYGGPAGLRLLQEVDKAGTQIGQGEWDRALRKSLVNVLAIPFHLPGGQVNRTLDGAEALAEDGTNNPAVVAFGAR